MFDKDRLDTLVSQLESAESDLTAKASADADARVAAAKAAADLSAAQATNRAAVVAIKQYAAGLSDDGDSPADPATGFLPGTGDAGPLPPAGGTADTVVTAASPPAA